MILFGMLVAVRAFESKLFYDPLISFFKGDFIHSVLPQMDQPKLFMHVSFRFLINTAISLSILWVLYRKKDVVKLAALLYVALFVLLVLAMFILLNTSSERGHMALFYTRRFLIQPLFLLLLIPAFYFQKKRG